MKQIKTIVYLLTIASALFACKSKIKEQDDDIYSRHLQRHVPLKVITTPMPDNKEEMNLLLVNSVELLDHVNAQKVVDSLFKKRLIQPLTIVAFEGKKENYGIVRSGNQANDAKEFKQFSDFIIGELYPFIKKKVMIRKFHSVATCGFGESAKNAFYMAFHNDDKIQMSGLFYPVFDAGELEALRTYRNQADMDIRIITAAKDSTTQAFVNLHDTKLTINNTFEYSAPQKTDGMEMPTPGTFADFLLWAFKK